jgi:uncharacterized membrane protein (DUF4010 family)
MSAAVLAGYARTARREQHSLGLTTELAAIAACLLGATTTLGQRDLAVGLGVAVAAVLAYKQPLHGIVLSWAVMFARLLIAVLGSAALRKSAFMAAAVIGAVGGIALLLS